jgi:branched-chain amino acid transport system ATP-binding protein
MSPSEALLALRDVSISFGGLRALQAVSLTVREGEILGLIGPNGAGKTTLFNVITRLYRADSGEAWLNGMELFRLRPHEVIGHGVARTFQNLQLFREMTVLDNVMVGLQARTTTGALACALMLPKARREDRRMRQRARQVLEIVGLASDMSRPARALPFGHQRLLELARALASGPRLLLLDEPGAGMNADELETLTQVIHRIHRHERVAVLLIGHTMRLVLGVSHRVAVLDHGLKIAEGTPREIRDDPQVIQAYLGKAEAGAPA